MRPCFRRSHYQRSSFSLFLFTAAIWGMWDCVGVAVGQSVAADPTPLHEPWRIVRFGVASGLPSAHVLDVIEAPDGTPWAATERGLAWYDGYRWNPVRRGEGALQAQIAALYGVLGNAVVFRCGDRIGIADTNAARLLPLRAVSNSKIIGGDTLLVLSEGNWFHVAGGSSQAVAFPSWFG